MTTPITQLVADLNELVGRWYGAPIADSCARQLLAALENYSRKDTPCSSSSDSGSGSSAGGEDTTSSPTQTTHTSANAADAGQGIAVAASDAGRDEMREVQFLDQLADEAERSGYDYGKGRATGIRETLAGLRKAQARDRRAHEDSRTNPSPDAMAEERRIQVEIKRGLLDQLRAAQSQRDAMRKALERIADGPIMSTSAGSITIARFALASTPPAKCGTCGGTQRVHMAPDGGVIGPEYWKPCPSCFSCTPPATPQTQTREGPYRVVATDDLHTTVSDRRGTEHYFWSPEYPRHAQAARRICQIANAADERAYAEGFAAGLAARGGGA